jgi:hypothetical protein
MMAEEIQIQTQSVEPMFTVSTKALVKINRNSNVVYCLRKGEKYYMYLPNTDELMHLECSGVAIRAADMKILKHIKKGNHVSYDINCTFGYQFEHYDAVNFASFKYREKCELYAEEEIYVPKQPLDALFVEDVGVSMQHY